MGQEMVPKRFRVLSDCGRFGSREAYLVRDELRDCERYLCLEVTPVLRTGSEQSSFVSEAHLLRNIHSSSILTPDEFCTCDHGIACGLYSLNVGHPIEDVLKSLTCSEFIGLTVALCHTLASIHRASLVHGSVDPRSVFVGDDHSCKLIDFSSGFVRGSDYATPRTAGACWGGAPEMAWRSHVDQRVDIYGVGQILRSYVDHHSSLGQDTDDGILLAQIAEKGRRFCAEDPYGRPWSAADAADELIAVRGDIDSHHGCARPQEVLLPSCAISLEGDSEGLIKGILDPLDNNSPSMVLVTGPRESGKSALASCLKSSLISASREVRMVDCRCVSDSLPPGKCKESIQQLMLKPIDHGVRRSATESSSNPDETVPASGGREWTRERSTPIVIIDHFECLNDEAASEVLVCPDRAAATRWAHVVVFALDSHVDAFLDDLHSSAYQWRPHSSPEVLRVPKLSISTAKAMAESLLGKDNIPMQISEWALDVSDGRHGLFLAAICTLVDEGILKKDVSNHPLRPEILDSTRPSDKHLAVFGQTASSILTRYGSIYEALLLGVPLGYSLLEEITAGGDELDSTLAQLVAKGLVDVNSENPEPSFTVVRSAISHVARSQLRTAAKRELKSRVGRALLRDSASPESAVRAAFVLAECADNSESLRGLNEGARELIRSGEPASAAACLETALCPGVEARTFACEELEIALYRTLAEAYEASGRMSQSLDVWEKLRRASETSNDNSLNSMDCLFHEARIGCTTGRTQAALRALSRAEDLIATTSGNRLPSNLIEGINLYSSVCEWRLGNFIGCLNRIESALNAAVESKGIEARLLNLKGICLQHMGKFGKAMDYLSQAEGMAMEACDCLALLMVQVNQGVVELARGNFDAASCVFQAASRGSRRASNASAEALCAFNLAETTILKGHISAACELLDYAAAESARAGDDLGLDCILSLHGEMLDAVRKTDCSLDVLRESVSRLQSRGSFVDLCLALTRLSIAESRTGQARKGLERAMDALEMAQKSGARLLEGCALRAVGIAHSGLDEPENAEASFRESAQVLEEIGAPYEFGRTLYERALNRIKAGDRTSAQSHLETAIHVFEKVGAKLDLRKSREALILCKDGELPYQTELPSDKERLKTLYQLGQVLETAKSIEELVERILQLAIDCVGGQNSALVLTTGPDSSVLRVLGGDEVCRTTAAAILSSDLMLTTEKRRCICTNEPGEEPSLKAFLPESSPVKSLLMAPLSVPGSIVGWLYLDYRDSVSKFSDEDATAALSFARQAALVFENCEFSDKLKSENEFLRCQMFEKYAFSNIIGCSARMLEVFDLLEKISDSDASVLITGESGTGKELIARAIHYNSSRRNERFVAQNCAALPKELLESELFGHIKGSFTSAGKDKVGLFELAHNGTFFLDEIADLDAGLQAKLLRVIEEGEIRRVGDVETRQINVRLLSATNRNILEEIDAGRFREDLYYRLNVIGVDVPPLRERREDIPVLSHYFLNRLTSSSGKRILGFTDAAMGALSGYDWPGNVRQLKNEIHRAFTLASDGSPVSTSTLSKDILLSAGVPVGGDTVGMTGLKEMLESIERSTIRRMLDETGWNKSKTAQALGISRQGLLKKIARYGLEES